MKASEALRNRTEILGVQFVRGSDHWVAAIRKDVEIVVHDNGDVFLRSDACSHPHSSRYGNTIISLRRAVRDAKAFAAKETKGAKESKETKEGMKEGMKEGL